MGKQGWNVNQAREIPGVVSIEFDDYSSMFTIRAEVSTCICIRTCRCTSVLPTLVSTSQE